MPLPPSSRLAFQQQADAIRLVLAYDDALKLALQERTGFEAQPGDAYTAEDAARAREILARCYREAE